MCAVQSISRCQRHSKRLLKDAAVRTRNYVLDLQSYVRSITALLSQRINRCQQRSKRLLKNAAVRTLSCVLDPQPYVQLITASLGGFAHAAASWLVSASTAVCRRWLCICDICTCWPALLPGVRSGLPPVLLLPPPTAAAETKRLLHLHSSGQPGVRAPRSGASSATVLPQMLRPQQSPAAKPAAGCATVQVPLRTLWQLQQTLNTQQQQQQQQQQQRCISTRRLSRAMRRWQKRLMMQSTAPCQQSSCGAVLTCSQLRCMLPSSPAQWQRCAALFATAETMSCFWMTVLAHVRAAVVHTPLASLFDSSCCRMKQTQSSRYQRLARKPAVSTVKMPRLRQLMQQPALQSLGRQLSLQQPALHQQRLRSPASTSLQHLQQRGPRWIALQTPPASCAWTCRRTSSWRPAATSASAGKL